MPTPISEASKIRVGAKGPTENNNETKEESSASSTDLDDEGIVSDDSPSPPSSRVSDIEPLDLATSVRAGLPKKDYMHISKLLRTIGIHKSQSSSKLSGDSDAITGPPPRLFGRDLIQHLKETGNEIPSLIRTCTTCIEQHGMVDGIYRLSGISSNIRALRLAFEASSEERSLFILNTSDPQCVRQDIHSISSLLKLYCRELPNPLCTFSLYERFLRVVTLSEEFRLGALRDAIRCLPRDHSRTLAFLMRHLCLVSQRGNDTGMTAKNLAIVWAPNLLRRRSEFNPSKSDPSSYLASQQNTTSLQDIASQATCTEYLIRFCDLLFSENLDYAGLTHSFELGIIPNDGQEIDIDRAIAAKASPRSASAMPNQSKPDTASPASPTRGRHLRPRPPPPPVRSKSSTPLERSKSTITLSPRPLPTSISSHELGQNGERSRRPRRRRLTSISPSSASNVLSFLQQRLNLEVGSKSKIWPLRAGKASNRGRDMVDLEETPCQGSPHFKKNTTKLKHSVSELPLSALLVKKQNLLAEQGRAPPSLIPRSMENSTHPRRPFSEKKTAQSLSPSSGPSSKSSLNNISGRNEAENAGNARDAYHRLHRVNGNDDHQAGSPESKTRLKLDESKKTSVDTGSKRSARKYSNSSEEFSIGNDPFDDEGLQLSFESEESELKMMNCRVEETQDRHSQAKLQKPLRRGQSSPQVSSNEAAASPRTSVTLATFRERIKRLASPHGLYRRHTLSQMQSSEAGARPDQSRNGTHNPWTRPQPDRGLSLTTNDLRERMARVLRRPTSLARREELASKLEDPQHNGSKLRPRSDSPSASHPSQPARRQIQDGRRAPRDPANPPLPGLAKRREISGHYFSSEEQPPKDEEARQEDHAEYENSTASLESAPEDHLSLTQEFSAAWDRKLSELCDEHQYFFGLNTQDSGFEESASSSSCCFENVATFVTKLSPPSSSSFDSTLGMGRNNDTDQTQLGPEMPVEDGPKMRKSRTCRPLEIPGPSLGQRVFYQNIEFSSPLRDEEKEESHCSSPPCSNECHPISGHLSAHSRRKKSPRRGSKKTQPEALEHPPNSGVHVASMSSSSDDDRHAQTSRKEIIKRIKATKSQSVDMYDFTEVDLEPSHRANVYENCNFQTNGEESIYQNMMVGPNGRMSPIGQLAQSSGCSRTSQSASTSPSLVALLPRPPNHQHSSITVIRPPPPPRPILWRTPSKNSGSQINSGIPSGTTGLEKEVIKVPQSGPGTNSTASIEPWSTHDPDEVYAQVRFLRQSVNEVNALIRQKEVDDTEDCERQRRNLVASLDHKALSNALSTPTNLGPNSEGSKSNQGRSWIVSNLSLSTSPGEAQNGQFSATSMNQSRATVKQHGVFNNSPSSRPSVPTGPDREPRPQGDLGRKSDQEATHCPQPPKDPTMPKCLTSETRKAHFRELLSRFDKGLPEDEGTSLSAYPKQKKKFSLPIASSSSRPSHSLSSHPLRPEARKARHSLPFEFGHDARPEH